MLCLDYRYVRCPVKVVRENPRALCICLAAVNTTLKLRRNHASSVSFMGNIFCLLQGGHAFIF